MSTLVGVCVAWFLGFAVGFACRDAQSSEETNRAFMRGYRCGRANLPPGRLQ